MILELSHGLEVLKPENNEPAINGFSSRNLFQNSANSSSASNAALSDSRLASAFYSDIRFKTNLPWEVHLFLM